MSPEGFLISALNSAEVQRSLHAPVFGDVPSVRPARFLTVERTGGPSERVLSRPVFAVQAWADTRAHAAALAELTASALHDIAALPQVGALRVEGIYNFPDPDSKEARYQLTVSAVLHLQA